MKNKNDNSSLSDHPSAAPRRYCLFPKALAKSIEQVVKPVYKKHGFAEHRILTEWAAIVGAELAACSIPQKLVSHRNKEGGTLHVLVASARALELQHMQPVIVDKIATYFGYPAVTRLTFMQTNLLRKEAKVTLRPKPQSNKEVARVVAQCEDEALRQALLSLGSTLAAVEK